MDRKGIIQEVSKELGYKEEFVKKIIDIYELYLSEVIIKLSKEYSETGQKYYDEVRIGEICRAKIRKKEESEEKRLEYIKKGLEVKEKKKASEKI